MKYTYVIAPSTDVYTRYLLNKGINRNSARHLRSIEDLWGVAHTQVIIVTGEGAVNYTYGGLKHNRMMEELRTRDGVTFKEERI